MKNENNIVEGQTLTSVDQVAGASNQDLRRTLLTTDGAGVKIKAVALDALMQRVVDKVAEMLWQSSRL